MGAGGSLTTGTSASRPVCSGPPPREGLSLGKAALSIHLGRGAPSLCLKLLVNVCKDFHLFVSMCRDVCLILVSCSQTPPFYGPFPSCSLTFTVLSGPFLSSFLSSTVLICHFHCCSVNQIRRARLLSSPPPVTVGPGSLHASPLGLCLQSSCSLLCL